ncbi:hypothetical protein [Nonomuraea sp. NPDC003201]
MAGGHRPLPGDRRRRAARVGAANAPPVVVTVRCYHNLRQWEGELAGMHSGSVTPGPVALLLGDLARLMGQDPDRHHARAEEVAELVGSPHWARAAHERRGHLP